MAVSNPVGAGATAYEVSARKFGGPVRPLSSVSVVGTTQGRILQNNPRRVEWMLVNRSGFDITVDFNQPVVAGSGFIIAANGGMLSASVDEDGEITAWELFAVSGGAGSNLFVLEIIRV